MKIIYKGVKMKKFFTVLITAILIFTVCFATACGDDNNGQVDGGKKLTVCTHTDSQAVGEYDYIDQTVYEEYACDVCGKCYKAVADGVVIDSMNEIKDYFARSQMEQEVSVFYLREGVDFNEVITVNTLSNLIIVGGGNGVIVKQILLGQSGSSIIENLTIKNIKFNDSVSSYLNIRCKVVGLNVINCEFSNKATIKCQQGSDKTPYSKTLRNVVIDNCRFYDIMQSNDLDSAISIVKCENLEITNCTFQNINIGNAIKLGPNEIKGSLNISNNTFGSLSRVMIEINDASNITSCTIENNVFSSQESKYESAVNENLTGLYINVLNGSITIGSNKWCESLDLIWGDSICLNNVDGDMSQQIQLS